ncbi:NAD(P)/FAD-dependent oxidoreductase [Candidatus Methylacidiphilum infernorum]|uniref:Glycine/D-amino acid oxidase (Deaminating) n=1 Tax=Methylacidiphilum infernorum (isolate V4) TaxID=481448 RepID=B3DXF5_METI4|nr:FAD-binding oxidoreductase [Candidatus Methylacidiphilum infernorum]ACD83864.1 Glycine/D-amino acid oxidase (deaminating) [Methylacidiphilum infernorum V4]
MEKADCIIIGAGIAGATAGFHLAQKGLSVIILEKEACPGYHSTGRSAVFYRGSHGLPLVRALTRASKKFFESPPEPFTYPLTTPRNALFIARREKKELLEKWFLQNQAPELSLEKITPEKALDIVPILKRESVEGGAVLETAGKDIHQPDLLNGYLKGVVQKGGKIYFNAPVRNIEKQQVYWRVEAGKELFEGRILVNAAGAWADEIAKLASIPPLGIIPKKRTVITFEPPSPLSFSDWPMVIEIGEEFYFKPHHNEILASPADQTPSLPCDAKPNESDCLLAQKRIEKATTLKIQKINRKWAGLRSFVKDEIPVIGFDPDKAGFFWVAALGGSGIETSPAVGEISSCLVVGEDLPEAYSSLNLEIERYWPNRLKKE